MPENPLANCSERASIILGSTIISIPNSFWRQSGGFSFACFLISFKEPFLRHQSAFLSECLTNVIFRRLLTTSLSSWHISLSKVLKIYVIFFKGIQRTEFKSFYAGGLQNLLSTTLSSSSKTGRKRDADERGKNLSPVPSWDVTGHIVPISVIKKVVDAMQKKWNGTFIVQSQGPFKSRPEKEKFRSWANSKLLQAPPHHEQLRWLSPSNLFPTSWAPQCLQNYFT